MSGLDHPFWRFSLALYAQPGVAPLCLELQDDAGLDVNLLLFALWRGVEGEALDAARLQQLDSLIVGWRETVVRPLRETRRALKPMLDQLGPHRAAADALRAEIAASELKAEQIAQALLYAEAKPPAAHGPKAHGEPSLALSNLANLMALATRPARALTSRDVDILTTALASKL